MNQSQFSFDMTITNSDLERELRDGVADLFTNFSPKYEAEPGVISDEVTYDLPDPLTAWFTGYNISEITPGVYKLYVDEECTYIGESLNVQRRLMQHVGSKNPTHFRYATLTSGMWGAHLGSVVGQDGLAKTLSRLSDLATGFQDGGIGKAVLRAEEQRLISEYVNQHGDVPTWNTEHPDKYR